MQEKPLTFIVRGFVSKTMDLKYDISPNIYHLDKKRIYLLTIQLSKDIKNDVCYKMVEI